jgi:hypothetical protein
MPCPFIFGWLKREYRRHPHPLVRQGGEVQAFQGYPLNLLRDPNELLGH